MRGGRGTALAVAEGCRARHVLLLAARRRPAEQTQPATNMATTVHLQFIFNLHCVRQLGLRTTPVTLGKPVAQQNPLRDGSVLLDVQRRPLG